MKSAKTRAVFAMLPVSLGVAIFHASALAQTPMFDPAKVQQGMQIAPVTLNTQGKDPNLVGYGSYLVNAVADCNGCHSAGPQTEFAMGGNPYFNQPTKVNPATYLGGGRDFGPFPSASGNFPHIISRNLTPDFTGMAEGGSTFDKFRTIIRTGMDMDHIHPTCSGPPDGKCIPPPFNGDLLQIMPWPTDQNMTDDDLLAIYTYLSAIPCLEGGPNEPPNRCVTPVKTMAIASPKNATVVSREIQLDGTKSTAGNGGLLTFQWSIPQGSPSAVILHGNTATPNVQFSQGRGAYIFLLTVTDTSGTSSSDVATITYAGN